MTNEEFDGFPWEVRLQIVQLENRARQLAMDIGPPRAAELMRTIADNVRTMKFVP
jgi:hypothetical protein